MSFVLLALALCWACAISASAAIPSHAREPARDIEGLKHACGIAVDSAGDLYAASAEDGEVKVYDSEHNLLTSIEAPNTPCALAVTSTGSLYVSEQATGEVVRYKPTEYPFVGAPSYGAREVIDASGEARGISVDPFDGRLYVAEGTRVSAYDAEGKLGVDEEQRVNCFLCTGGEYKLIFGGEETDPIKFEGPAEEVRKALEKLTSIGPDDVSVINEEGSNRAHLITFIGELAHTDVELLSANKFTIGGGGSQKVSITEQIKGWNGRIGDGDLTQATGVAPYTYEATKSALTYHLAVADEASDQVKLFSAASFKEQKLRRTLDGPKEGEEFGFGAQGAYLGSDPGSCPPAGQACTAGHFFLSDDEHEAIDEFEADGELVSQTSFAFGDADPTAIAVDRSGGEDDGTLYATAGASTGARALAFAPLAPPSRSGPEPSPLSLALPKACSVAVDEYGNRYVAVGPEILIYPPTGSAPLAKIAEGSGSLCRVGVDGEGNVYALFKGEVAYFAPSSFPPAEGTTYGPKLTVAEQGDFKGVEPIGAFGLDPAGGQLFVTNSAQTIEYASAKGGSGILDLEFGAGLGLGTRFSVAVRGRNGDVYISTEGGGGSVYVLDKEGKEVLTRISGVGSPAGSLGNNAGAIAVDQASGHVIVFAVKHEEVEEYEPSGTFLAAFGGPYNPEVVTTAYGLAVDDGAFSPNRGTAYLAYDAPGGEGVELAAFGGLGYGETPDAATGLAAEVGGGSATLKGSVDPHGFEVEDCRFEYTPAQDFEEEGFASAEEAPCEPAEVGKGTEPVSVQAKISGLEPEGRYRFHLLTENKYGTGESDPPGFFGRPQATAQAAQPVFYGEATLRAQVNPWGLLGSYRFEYVDQPHFESEGFEGATAKSTPDGELEPGGDPVAVSAPLSGIAANTLYHYRIVAESEAGSDVSEGQFATPEEPAATTCPNSVFRTGPSAALPDCRAYELVTPAQTNGYLPFWSVSEFINGNFPTALAAADGQSVVFETEGPLPSTAGNGVRDGYRARRSPGGWSVSLYGPTGAQTNLPGAGGVSADHGYSFWTAKGEAGSLDPPEGAEYAHYLALPQAGGDPMCSPEPAGRFAWIGCGSEGEEIDPEAIGRWISPGAGHVIFTSEEKLEPNAPAKGTLAIYDRSPGGPTHVVSLLPGGKVPSTSATYRGASADGSAVAFRLGGTLYVCRDNAEALKVGGGAGIFAGFARDGSALFYLEGEGLYRYDIAGESSTQIASGDATFVNVASEGTRAYFTSTKKLAPGAIEGAHNLYLWDASDESTSLVAILDPTDLKGVYSLVQWVKGLDPEGGGNLEGPAIDPSRSTPDGEALVFESHADLTGYEANGHTEIFRYDASGEGGLTCISCGPEGTTANSDAELQDHGEEGKDSPTRSDMAPIANLSEDGETAFFISLEQLLPTDRNGVADVYEWREGALSLISTGKSSYASYLYAVSASGSDVFFATREGLLPEDGAGGRSIYDARVGGGFEAPAGADGCEGEGCLPPSSAPATPPGLIPPPSTSSLSAETPNRQARHCPKGKHKVKRSGKVRCVKKAKKQHHKKHRRRRASR